LIYTHWGEEKTERELLLESGCTAWQIDVGACKAGLGMKLKLLFRNDLNETSNDKDNNESPSIFDAVEWGDKDLVEKLIKSGVDINTTKSGGSILTAVIENGQKEIIKFLLANGANINEDNENKEILFLDLNFDINSIDKNGITPLMLAVDCEQQNPVAFLIGQGADLEITNADNETALDVANARLFLIRGIREENIDKGRLSNANDIIALLLAQQ